MSDAPDLKPIADHDEYLCPGCPGLAEYWIVADVYGCAAGRHCTEATPEQRIKFEDMIAERIAALVAVAPEGT